MLRHEFTESCLDALPSQDGIPSAGGRVLVPDMPDSSVAVDDFLAPTRGVDPLAS